jgi:hypothetical protein
MRLRSFAYPSAISALLFFAHSNAAAAQSPQTEGVAVAVSGIVMSQNNISVQLVIKNNRNARVYLMDARTDDSQTAFLGSGAHLNAPMIASLNSCNGSAAMCIANPNDTGDLNKFTYIEPENSSGLGLSYYVPSPVKENDTISFSVALIARFAEPGRDQSQPGRLHTLRVTFPYLKLNQK